MHLSPNGYFMEAVRRFEKAGGTAFNLVNLPNYSLPLGHYYESVYDTTMNIAERVRNESSVIPLVTLGPYPLDYFMFQKAGIDPVEKMTEGIELAGRIVKKGRANAIGEIGRPHFGVEQEVIDQCNSMIMKAMEIARDSDCAVVLHTEDLDQEALQQIADMARRSNLSIDRVVKHHEMPENLGLQSRVTASILASRSNIRTALEITPDFMIETDYVDDPGKPDKVIPADSVPKRAIMIKSEYGNWEEIFHKMFVEIPSKVYGVDYFVK